MKIKKKVNLFRTKKKFFRLSFLFVNHHHHHLHLHQQQHRAMTTKKEEEFEEKKEEEEEKDKGRKEERRSLSVVKKTELYSSLDATTIEIFFTEEDIMMEKEEVSHRFIFDSEGDDDPVGIEIKVGREEKFAFDLRKHHPVLTDPEFVRVRCGKKKIEVKLMKKKNQKREEEKEQRSSSSVSEEKNKVGNARNTTTSSTVAATTSLDGVGDEGKTTSLDKPPADKWTRLEFLGEMEEELETLDGEDGLNKMFQDLYKDADDDQRRAMMKSFVESNGTVLSTDWTDVGKKFVEPQAP